LAVNFIDLFSGREVHIAGRGITPRIKDIRFIFILERDGGVEAGEIVEAGHGEVRPSNSFKNTWSFFTSTGLLSAPYFINSRR